MENKKYNISRNRKRNGQPVVTSYDCDGLISDFWLAYCLKFNEPVETIKEWDQPGVRERFAKLAEDEDFWYNLPPMIHPYMLAEFDYYLTHIPENLRQVRIDWLKRHNFPRKPVIISGEKWKEINRLGIELHIDDKLSTIVDVGVRTNATGVLYVPYYFHKDYGKGVVQNIITNLWDVRNFQ